MEIKRCLCFVFGLLILPIGVIYANERYDDHCFCDLKGAIQDCDCNIETVDDFNKLLLPKINELVKTDFFRFFKANLGKKCLFWPDDSKCLLRDCAVSTCEDEIVPDGIKGNINSNQRQRYTKKKIDDCKEQDIEEKELSRLDTTISPSKKLEFEEWHEYDFSKDNFCILEDQYSKDAPYIDLLLNPERYTGYRGFPAQRVWSSIYLENCFTPVEKYRTPKFSDLFTTDNVNSMCLEKRSFFRAVSGLHSSINIHLCAHYLINDYTGKMDKFGYNVHEFQRRFDPETTNGQGPEWLKNLYFVYLLELKAIYLASSFIERYNFFTGNPEEDEYTNNLVKTIIEDIKAFPNHFNENVLFRGSYALLKENFRDQFLNISRIMDCVGCDKCRLWGKLQTQGLGTALKILFTKNGGSRLDRGELVSLFNAFGRLSNSVHHLLDFRKLVRKH